ncbi:MAG: tetratricopeptide repeat protein [Roseiflexaceae bacterium]
MPAHYPLDGTVPDRYTPSAMSHTSTTEPTDALPPAAHESVVAARRPRFRRSRLIVVLLACILLALAWLLTPMLRWAYDIERAGWLIDVGLGWPTPRQAASLPQARDQQALEQALVYLDDAMRRRPDHAHAYRLAAEIYAARADWERAVTMLDQARASAPQNPLYAWEAGLMYDQMRLVVEQAPRTSLLDTFAGGHLIAPGQLVKSLYCNDQGAASCYFGRSAYIQPFAAFPDHTAVELPVLFLHPPASVEQSLLIPLDQPALSFVIGLDPVAREWNSDGATFRVWATRSGGTRQLVTELSLDRATALRGWVPGWADLTPWAGQTITLALESHPGPADDLNDDWYGWGNLTLTSVSAARYATLLPDLRMAQVRAGLR